MTDFMVEALRRLVDREGGAVAVADRLEVNDQSIYQILKGVLLPSGKAKGVGPRLRARLDQHYPGWLTAGDTTAGTSSPGPTAPAAPPSLEQALAVVLGHLPGLSAYDESKVLTALRAAIRSEAPLDDVERDLLQWLSAPRTTAARPADPPGKRSGTTG